MRAKKNLADVLRGLAEVVRRRGPRYQLVVTGPDTPDLRRDLGLAARVGLNRYVSTPGHVAEGDLPALLRLATVVPVLSHSEGFAFPVLEAMACGTPVIVPRNSAQAELAGPAGIEVDPHAASAVADALQRAHAERYALRSALIARVREGAEIPILTPTLTIGRATKNATWDISLQDRAISRPHSEIALQEDKSWAVKDLGSANGTFLNGERIDEAPVYEAMTSSSARRA